MCKKCCVFPHHRPLLTSTWRCVAHRSPASPTPHPVPREPENKRKEESEAVLASRRGGVKGAVACATATVWASVRLTTPLWPKLGRQCPSHRRRWGQGRDPCLLRCAPAPFTPALPACCSGCLAFQAALPVCSAPSWSARLAQLRAWMCAFAAARELGCAISSLCWRYLLCGCGKSATVIAAMCCCASLH
jgi:hypothetical protein